MAGLQDATRPRPACLSRLILQSSPYSPLSNHSTSSISSPFCLGILLLPVPAMLCHGSPHIWLLFIFKFIFRCCLPSKATVTLHMKVPPPLFSIMLFNFFRKLITICSDLNHLALTCLLCPLDCWVHKGKIIIANTSLHQAPP